MLYLTLPPLSLCCISFWTGLSEVCFDFFQTETTMLDQEAIEAIIAAETSTFKKLKSSPPSSSSCHNAVLQMHRTVIDLTGPTTLSVGQPRLVESSCGDMGHGIVGENGKRS
jgi:hypothetical protein